MKRVRTYGMVWLIGTLVVIGIVGAVAYNAGMSAGLASSAAGAGHLVVVPGFGFGFFGLLPILFLFLIGFALFSRRPRWYGPSGMRGHGFERPESWLNAWHQQAHGTPAPNAGEQPPQDASRKA